MNTTLDRIMNVLAKVQFDEAQEVLNELRTMKLQSLNETGVMHMKVSVLKAAQASASKAYQALEGLDEADELLALVALINKEILETNK